MAMTFREKRDAPVKERRPNPARVTAWAAVVLAALCAAGAPVHAQAPTVLTSEPLVLSRVTVIDTAGGRPLPDRTVVIRGGRITEVGPAEKVRVPRGARVVDARGKFLIPGLWDMHVHWGLKDYLPLFIANGVTGVRIMWGAPVHHGWQKEIESGTLLAPRMVVGSRIFDGPRPFWPGSVAIGNEQQAREAVQEAKQEGAEFIKVYSLLPRGAFFAIAEEARKLGLDFAGHVPQSVTVEEASRSGQKSIEHLFEMFFAASGREAELRKERAEAVAAARLAGDPLALRRVLNRFTNEAILSYDAGRAAALFELLRRNGTWQCPTLTVLRSTARRDDPALAADPRLKYLPAGLRESWKGAPGFQNWTPEDFANQRRIYARNVELVGAMRRAGVGFLAGTDVMNPYCFPGFSLHDELALLVGAGLTPAEALRAATLNPARFLGREEELGTVEKGKLADLVLLEASPLGDIRNTQKIAGVVYRGKWLPRAELDNLLKQVEELANRP
jgi:imidazolonepropionase-like amidohydrolase